MSLQYNTNQTPATGAVALFNLKTLLKAQGWTVPRSGDGTSFFNASDGITTGSSGAGGLGNSNAWFVIQMPLANGVNRQFCIQRGANNTAWRIKYSYSGGFTGGAPSATQTPSATDEKIFNGAGTDAAPTFTAIFAADGTYRHNLAADSASPYGFWSIGFPSGGGTPSHAFFMDPMAAGSFPSGDTDPYVMMVSGTGNGAPLSGGTSRLQANAALNLNVVYGFLAKGLGGEGFVSIPGLQYNSDGSTLVVPGVVGTNPSSSNDDLFPVIYARVSSQTAPVGYKGRSSLFTYGGSARSSGDTITVTTTRDRVVFGNVVAAWDGSVPTV